MVRGIGAAAAVTSWVQQETTTASTSPGLSAVEKSSWPLSGKGMVEFCVLMWERFLVLGSWERAGRVKGQNKTLGK